MSATPRPWTTAPGNFIVSVKTGQIIAEVPCCGANDADLEFIVRAVNTFDEAKAALEKLVRVLSHIQDMGLADPLKYVPISAYKEAYAEAKAVLAKLKEGAE